MNLDDSREIFQSEIGQHEPYAIVMAMSGGNDSLTAYYIAKKLGIKIDFILHINTRTGIAETTDFVRRFAESEGVAYLEADAGLAYENYVLRKGFFGRGRLAHMYAYHVLKREHLSKTISKHIRQGKRNRNVLLLNGARLQESENRAKNLTGKEVRPDAGMKSNIWVNLCHNWSKADCQTFLGECKAQKNPVAELLCRSGECLCGTMQNQQVREEAAYWFPEWGQWLDRLEGKVAEKFPWKWGEDPPKTLSIESKTGQLRLFDYDFQPMCSSCNANTLETIQEVKA